MTQGYEANHSGKFLEDIVQREFSARGFLFRSHGDDAGNLDMFSRRIVLRNVPYRSLYGCTSRSEFVVTDGSRKVRVECRWQEVNGSVDEKYPYLLRNATERMPEQEVLILLGGDGARPEAIDWLKLEASRVLSKKIYVLNINEFPRWVRDQFLRPFTEAAE
jgi:PD-(D/E)XK nuclease superfamily protein